MTIDNFDILTENVQGNVRVRLTFRDTTGPTFPSADVIVFVPAHDSVAGLKKAAIEAARALFEKALAAPPIETP